MVNAADGGGGGGTEIKVDFQGLEDFGGQVEGDLDGGFQPGANRVNSTFTGDMPFGNQHWGSVVMQARRDYHEQLQRSTELMSSFVQLAEGMARAARHIAESYRQADQNAMTRADAAYVDGVIRYFNSEVHREASLKAPPSGYVPASGEAAS